MAKDNIPTTKLNRKQWDELQKIIAEDRGPNPALLRAAEATRRAIEAGELIPSETPVLESKLMSVIRAARVDPEKPQSA